MQKDSENLKLTVHQWFYYITHRITALCSECSKRLIPVGSYIWEYKFDNYYIWQISVLRQSLLFVQSLLIPLKHA